MTEEQQVKSALKIYQKLVEQGAEVVYGAKVGRRFGLSTRPFEAIRGSDQKPENTELRSEEDVRKWLS